MVGFIVAAWSAYSILSAYPGRSFTELAPLTLVGVFLIGAGAFGYVWRTGILPLSASLSALPCRRRGKFMDS